MIQQDLKRTVFVKKTVFVQKTMAAFAFSSHPKQSFTPDAQVSYFINPSFTKNTFLYRRVILTVFRKSLKPFMDYNSKPNFISSPSLCKIEKATFRTEFSSNKDKQRQEYSYFLLQSQQEQSLTSQNSQQQIQSRLNEISDDEKYHIIFDSKQRSERGNRSLNKTQRTQILADRQYSIPQTFISIYMKKNGIHTYEDPRIKQNTLLYNLELRLRYQQQLSQAKENRDVGMAFGYQLGYRGLFNYAERTQGERIISVSRCQLIDLNRSLKCDIVEVIRRDDQRFSSVSELTKRVLFLFENKFIKKEYNLQKRKRFRKQESKSLNSQVPMKQPLESIILPKKLIRKQVYFTRKEMMLEQILDLYLQLLPASYDDLPGMDKKFAKYFKGDKEIVDKRHTKADHINELYSIITEKLDVQHLQIFWRHYYPRRFASQFCELFHEHFNRKNISWCFNVIATRSFSVVQSHRYRNGGEITFLAPLIDLVNHNNDNNCQWGYDYENDVFYLEALKPIAIGQQFTIRYGNLSNITLLMNYGICMANNRQESGVTIYPQLDKLFDIKSRHQARKMYHLVAAAFPWLVEGKQPIHMRKIYCKNRKASVSLCLYSSQFEPTLKKTVRRLLSQFYNTYIRQFYGTPVDPIQGQEGDRSSKVVTLLVRHLKLEVQQILSKKELNLIRLERCNPKQLATKTHCILLMKEQIRTCILLGVFFQRFGRESPHSFIQSLR